MAEPTRSILQVSSRDIGGGAEGVAFRLFESYRNQGHRSWLAVGQKQTTDPDVFLLDHDRRRAVAARVARRLASLLHPLDGRIRGVRRSQRLLLRMGEPRRLRDYWHGREDFDYPATATVLHLPPATPEILHCHNLHGDYFDLRALPDLSRTVPTILTLHDAWLLSGHCAHSFACDRWRTGCGECPDLRIPPAILRDATAANWLRKRELYAHSRLYVATPCHWLLERVRQSMLEPALVTAAVIPNGIDLTVFRPADKSAARAALGLPVHGPVLLFAANGIRRQPFKDFQTLRAAVSRLAERFGDQPLLLVALGEEAPVEHVGRATIRFIPFTASAPDVARYYQAADVYLHVARADTFPNSVLEALACGVPVVATAVGGIPEQICGLDSPRPTGILTPAANPVAMAEAVTFLLRDPTTRAAVGVNAAADARQRFDLRDQVRSYLEFYAQALETHRTCPPPA